MDNKVHGFIQWKGTDVCMDVYCKCGNQSHIDGYCAYYIKCLNCNTIYRLDNYIQLIQLTEEPQSSVICFE